MDRLIKTNSGNWAKQTTITAGGKWRFCGHFGTLEQAQAAQAIHAAKGRKTELAELANADGSAYWRVDAYVSKQRQVMVHATAAECETAGVTAGPCNS